MKILRLFIIIILPLYTTFFSGTVIAEDISEEGRTPPAGLELPSTQPRDEFTVGIITLSPPELYVIVEDKKAKKKRLYKKDAYRRIKNKDLKLLRAVWLDTIEYRYKPIYEKVELVWEEFEFVELKGKKAVLKREFIEKPEKIIEQEEITIEEEIEEIAEEEPKEEISAKRLLAELFFKIESKKISDHEWEISLPTIMDAAANFATVLGIVTKKIDELLDPEKRSKIYFNTSLGKGALGPNGLLIKSLNSRLRAKCGIKDDDLIKTVNGKNLTAIQDIAVLFSSFAGSPQTLTVKLIRDDTDLTLTYYIK